MFRNIRTAAMTLAALAAIAVGASAIATAASNSGSNSGTNSGAGDGTSAQQTATDGTGRQGDQTPGHGPNETLLTGSTASKVEQAATDKVPGATVLRVETDAQGSPYEAHLQKSDGSQVTVKVDKQFNATAVESGFGHGPRGGGTSSAPQGGTSY